MTTHKAKTITTTWAIILLVMSPSKLVAHSIDHAIRSQPCALTPEREQELRNSFTTQFQNSVSLVRSSLFRAFLVVAGAIVAALVSANVLQTVGVYKSSAWNAWLQYGSIGILLWATLGRVESPIQTWDGGTLPEHVDLWLYRSLYVVGSYGLALSIAW
jgi:hypothetical protein